MRSIRFSKTFDEQLIDYIDAGVQTFGDQVASEKKALVYKTIRLLATNPTIKRRSRSLGLVVYPILATPFFILYDYDAAELRVHFIFI